MRLFKPTRNSDLRSTCTRELMSLQKPLVRREKMNGRGGWMTGQILHTASVTLNPRRRREISANSDCWMPHRRAKKLKSKTLPWACLAIRQTQIDASLHLLSWALGSLRLGLLHNGLAKFVTSALHLLPRTRAYKGLLYGHSKNSSPRKAIIQSTLRPALGLIPKDTALFNRNGARYVAAARSIMLVMCSRSLNYWTRFRTSSVYCDALFSDWKKQTTLTPAQNCPDCLLGIKSMQLNSPFGYDNRLASDLSSSTLSL